MSTSTVVLTAEELQLILDAFGTVSGGWNLTAAENALVRKLEAAKR